MILNLFKFIIVVSLSIYFFYGCFLYFAQDKIIFYPTEHDPEEIEYIKKQLKNFDYKIYKKNKEIIITYWESDPKKEKFKIILYFGGNAENTNYTAIEISKHPEFLNYKWILLNYPEYNGSSGKAGEKNFYLYSEIIFEHIIDQYKENIIEIILMGRSIGSGVASYLNSIKKIDKLILITPFDSIETIAKKHFSLYPFSFLIKHKFPTIEYIKKINNPILVLIAKEDEIIPSESTNNLIKELEKKQDVKIYILDNATHNTISNFPNYWKYLDQFIKK